MSTDMLQNAFGLPDPDVISRMMRELRTVFHPTTPFVAPPDAVTNGRLFDLTASSEPESLQAVLREAFVRVVPYAPNGRHPLAIAHMVPPPSTISVLADFIIGAMNQCAFIWEQAPLSSELERVVVSWLRERLNLPSSWNGILTSGGTVSNSLTLALALRRADLHRSSQVGCVLCSDQAHLSIEKAAALSAGHAITVVRVKTTNEGRLESGEILKAAALADAQGLSPVLVVCTAGTPNGGTIEPLQEYLDVAQRYGAWCHVDAAHGGMLSLGSVRPRLLDLWASADSISWDPHKSLYVSYASGALFLREARRLEIFKIPADYTVGDSTETTIDYGHLDGSRRFEALKLWMTIRYWGVRGYAEMTDRVLSSTKALCEGLLHSGVFDIVTQPDTNVLCFRIARPALDAHHLAVLTERVQRRLYRTGGPLLSRTRIAGRATLRAVVVNPLITSNDVADIVERCVEAVRQEVAHLQLI